MVRTALLVLVFLSAADVLTNDSKVSYSAVRMTETIWYQFVGR
jgi:hypothetical protein